MYIETENNSNHDHKILWSPTKEQIESSYLKKFITFVNERLNKNLINYETLHKFSVKETHEFWDCVWDFCGVLGNKGKTVYSGEKTFEKIHWFPEAKLNYAENCLTRAFHEPGAPFFDLSEESRQNNIAIIFNGENKIFRELTFGELKKNVLTIQTFFKTRGLKKGDRVAFLVANAPETVVCVLAAASLGLICSLASTDFGANGVIERFEQIEPKMFIYHATSVYNGKTIENHAKAAEVVKRINSIQSVMVLNCDEQRICKSKLEQYNAEIFNYNDLIAHQAPIHTELKFEQVEFSHPLFIMFSSGTTGVPKCIVHGHGGTLLQHKKEHMLHCDIKPGDKVFYYTTCGWMMYQWLLSTLSSGATLVLYEGSPVYPNHKSMLNFLDTENISLLGTSAKYIDGLRKLNFHASEHFSFKKLRMITSTGSPLVPESFEYIYNHFKKDVCLASISGGTDIISCFVLGCPIKPVHKGEIQCVGLGMDIHVFSDNGTNVQTGITGDLICKTPFPNTPVCFWNDPSGAKYKKSYFEKFPPFWAHGDWMSLTQNGGAIIYGRSDSTLNPGGVRIGTAEIYRQVECFEEILEAVVTEKYHDHDSSIALFVKMKDNYSLNTDLKQKIKDRLRQNCSPRHVPKYIFQVTDIPKTKSGKIVELAVKHVINGKDVPNKESMMNPEALEFFKNCSFV